MAQEQFRTFKNSKLTDFKLYNRSYQIYHQVDLTVVKYNKRVIDDESAHFSFFIVESANKNIFYPSLSENKAV